MHIVAGCAIESIGSGCKDSDCGCRTTGGQYFSCGTDILNNPSYSCSSTTTSSVGSCVNVLAHVRRPADVLAYQSIAIDCPAGSYGPARCQKSCSTCSAGTYAAAGSSSCTSCPAGTYSGSGAGSCASCAANTYSTGGAASCTGTFAFNYTACMGTAGRQC